MRIENGLKPRCAEQLWRLIKDIGPADPNGFLRPMEEHEFNMCGRLPESARPDPGLVFKFIRPDLYTALPEWNWDWLFRFKESPLSSL
eukprot:5501538-Alexandrium_andersonii.AAC.1